VSGQRRLQVVDLLGQHGVHDRFADRLFIGLVSVATLLEAMSRQGLSASADALGAFMDDL
jgi:hypothetical protein